MAQPKRGTSPHTRRRRALQNLADLAVQREKLAHSRPQTSGKKSAKTRALNKLERRIRAARGQLTKALRAIAQGARTRTAAKALAKQKRSAAAKRGLEARGAGKATPIPPSTRTIGHLTPAGVQDVWPPSKADRSKEGSYWNEVDSLLSNRPASFERFEGESIYDEISGKRLPFVTDPDIILAHSDRYHFGEGFYRDRRGGRAFAA
jgi:hypothetical protein